MASSRNEFQIQWAGAAFKVVAANTTELSDVFAFNAEDWAAAVQLSVDNDGTAGAGDLVEFRVAYSTGDILGDSGDDYDTPEHAQPLAVIDTVPANTPGEDPTRVTVTISCIPKGARIIAINRSTARTMTVRARLLTHRPQ